MSALSDVALLSLLLATSACGSQQSAREQEVARNVPVETGECHAASDCDSGQRCAPTEENSARRNLLMVAPCMTPQPLYVPCSTDAECSEGQICTTDKDPIPVDPFAGVCPQFVPISVCNMACTDATCPLGTRCEEDGHCRLIPCDDPAGMCPDGFTCDPQVAALGLTANEATVPGGLTTEGVDLALSSPIDDLHRSGCLLLHCDEAGGFGCSPGYVCDRALTADTSVGCAVLDCHDWGRCSSESYICEPTSSNPRPDGMDVHGCSLKNCEEGFDCGVNRVCDFSRPDVDDRGCSFVQCDEVGAMPCSAGYSCKPGQEHANVYGCAPTSCTEGFECAATATCDPGAPNATANGCVPGDVVPAPSGSALSDPSPISTNDGAGGTQPTPTPFAPGEEPAGSAATSSDPGSTGGTSSDDDVRGPIPGVRPDGEPPGGACIDDIDCQTGFCVNRTCRASLGQCQ